MLILKKPTLITFWGGHLCIGEALRTWHFEARQAGWTTPDDLKQRFPGADILPGDRVVFNIQRNQYRLGIQTHYNTDIVDNHSIDMQPEYDRIKAETI